MSRYLISDAHELFNEIHTLPVYYLANPGALHLELKINSKHILFL